MTGIITVIIHDYAILMKYYSEYPKHSREEIEQNQFLIISLQRWKQAEVWHTSDRDVTLCPLCAFHFHVFWLSFNIMKLKEASYNFEICIYCII